MRNETVHNKRPSPIKVSTRFLFSYITSLLVVQASPHADHVKGKMGASQLSKNNPLSHVRWERKNLAWEPPSAGWVALSIDGSFSKVDNTARAGMVLRDECGAIIYSSRCELQHCATPLQSELATCVEGISLAI